MPVGEVARARVRCLRKRRQLDYRSIETGDQNTTQVSVLFNVRNKVIIEQYSEICFNATFNLMMYNIFLFKLQPSFIS
jgi:hypothetical protein